MRPTVMPKPENQPHAARHPMLGIVILTAMCIVVTVVAVAASGLKFANAERFFLPIGGLLAGFLTLNAYQYVRMPENKKLILVVNMTAIYIVMTVVMMTYQYCLALADAYEISEVIEKIDSYLGFDWLTFAMKANSIPYLSEALGFCYQNWMREFILVFAALVLLSRGDDLRELTVTYILAGMTTLTVSGLVDAKSYDAVASYAIGGLHHPSGVAPEYLTKIENLRHGVDSVMDYHNIIGLVSFPSFHAGAAVLLASATRNLGWFSLPFLVFNALVLVGTVTEGGHNLTDVIAGGVISIAAIALVQSCRPADALAKMAERVALKAKVPVRAA